jgi:transcriptional regulator with XRE-family HTH domain
MPHSPIGDSHDDVMREESERDPAFASVQEEARFEAQAGLAVAQMREQRDLSQRALGERAGMPYSMVNRIEKAGQIPTITTLWKLVRALDAEATIRPEGITIQPSMSTLGAIFEPETRPVLNFWEVMTRDISNWASNSPYMAHSSAVVTVSARLFDYQPPEKNAEQLDMKDVQRFLSSSNAASPPATPRHVRKSEEPRTAYISVGGQ